MKKSNVIGIITIAMVLLAFGFTNKNQNKRTCSQAQEVPTVKSSGLTNQYLGAVYASMNIPINTDDLFYAVGGKYGRSITLAQLNKPQAIDEIIPDYPSNWIAAYSSVEITKIQQGESQTARSKNNVLTNEQKNMFSQLTIGDDLHLKVNYQSLNSVTNQLEAKEMMVNLTVIPAVEATYMGGYEMMMAYLKNNSRATMKSTQFSKTPAIVVNFTVNATGGVEQVALEKSTDLKEIDDLFMDLIKNMPAWNAAKTATGEPTHQYFQFRLGMDGC